VIAPIVPPQEFRPSAWGRIARRLRWSVRQTKRERFLKYAAEARGRVVEISPQELVLAARSGALVIDVRERGEFSLRHIPDAEQFGRGVLDLEIEKIAPDPAAPIVCYCNGGNRSAIAADTLQRMGYTNVRTLRGGLAAWVAAGLPTAREWEADE